MKHLVTGALAAALAFGTTVPPAEAATAGAHGVAAGTVLRLTLTYPSSNTSGTRTVVLRCDPPGGDHPKAAQACADLTRSSGRFDHDPARNEVCPMIYHPVIAQATGRWHSKGVRFRKRYGNDCVMRSRTARVFAF
ncbi:SSI family serine proteinase inhibitor [Actinomadura harenae]|uniref:Subtilisin inhibitor domain-containing protein n=1 Tax=Actinomadura harenae TaxID=2483351 RepID=A0A3M2LLD7_9ACTN|nr:SSI family serine proteinase inhibitor [Actinomadura harenae]RMI36885.1 hypothetical protein EBO15_37340 [Actinomadura harenae]